MLSLCLREDGGNVSRHQKNKEVLEDYLSKEKVYSQPGLFYGNTGIEGGIE